MTILIDVEDLNFETPCGCSITVSPVVKCVRVPGFWSYMTMNSCGFGVQAPDTHRVHSRPTAAHAPGSPVSRCRFDRGGGPSDSGWGFVSVRVGDSSGLSARWCAATTAMPARGGEDREHHEQGELALIRCPGGDGEQHGGRESYQHKYLSDAGSGDGEPDQAGREAEEGAALEGAQHGPVQSVNHHRGENADDQGDRADRAQVGPAGGSGPSAAGRRRRRGCG